MNPINNLITAALAASLLSTIFSMVWYSSKVFGGRWAKLARLEERRREERRKEDAGSKMLTSFFATFTMAIYLAMVLAKFEVQDYCNGALIGLFMGIGIAAPALLINNLWESRPRDLYLITAAHHALSLILMGMAMVMVDRNLPGGVFSALQ